MARDILLSFGVTSDSAATIRNSINKIVAGLSPKIKIDVDGDIKEDAGIKQLTELDKYIKQLYNDLNKLGSNRNKGMEAIRDQLNSMLQSANGFRGAMLGKNGVGLDTFIDKMAHFRMEYEELQLAMAKTGQTKFFEAITAGSSQYATFLGQIEERLRRVAELQNNLKSGKLVSTDPGAGKILDDANDSLQRMKATLDGMPVEVFRTAMADVNNELKKFDDSSTSVQKLEEGSVQYATALNQIDEKLRQIDKLQQDLSSKKITFTDTNTEQSLSNTKSQLEGIKENLDGMDVNKFQVAMASAKGVIDSANSNATKLLAFDTPQYAQYAKQIQTMTNAVQELQDKLQSGKGIGGRQAAADLEALSGEIKTFSQSMIGMSTEKAAQQLAGLQQRVEALRGTVGRSSNIFSNFLGGFGAGIRQYLAMTLSWTRIIMTTIQEMKQLVNTAVELDTAFTQLQIVTRASDAEISAFSSTLAESAKNMSASVKDMAEVATVYARLGYSLDESNVLAKYTAMLQNVGDIDPSAASDSITAIVKAYGIGVEEIESVMDRMVVVGNNFPISVSQIAEGMNNASSMMANAGMSFEQSVAMLTAANTTVNLCRAA